MTLFNPLLFAEKTRRSVNTRGWRGTYDEAVTRFKRSRTRRVHRYLRELAFDLRHGTRIRGIVKYEKRGAFEQAFRCESTPRSWLLEALSDVTVAPAQYAFVDIGCGRGFVLLNVLRRGYTRIIGIELAPQIAAEARANVDAYMGRHGLTGSVEIVVADATTWELPREPSVLYFSNPFSREIFERMRRHIEESLRREPRELYVIYTCQESRDVFDDSAVLEVISSRRHHVVYRSRPVDGDVVTQAMAG